MEEMERHAQEVLAEVPDWLWEERKPPVPVEDIADTCFNLLVRDVEEMTAAPGCPKLEEGQAISGLLLPALGEIWVNAAEAREWPPRRRFTIAHELGHWVLHRPGQQALFCRHGSVDPEDEPATTRPPLPVPEEEANAFAAALLMPADLVRRYYERVPNHAALCRIFDSSGSAMGKRLHAVIG